MSTVSIDENGHVSVDRTIDGRALMIAHLFVAWQAWMILDPWEAMLYVVFPISLPTTAATLVGSPPLFALLCLSLPVMSLRLLCSIPGPSRTGFEWGARALLGIAIAMWMPVLAGEGVRWLLMKPVLDTAPKGCSGSVDLFESIERKLSRDGFRLSHAWAIRDGQAWLWSYRNLRFEPAPDWAGIVTLPRHCAAALSRSDG